jgi:hypothetical protein
VNKTERACWILALMLTENSAVFPGLNVDRCGHGYRVTSAQFDRFVQIHGLEIRLSPDGGRMAQLPRVSP